MKSKKNGKVYVGSTTKIPKIRVNEHNNGSNQWSRYNGPFLLKYFEKYQCEKDAKLREKFYKTGFGKQIKELILKLIESKNIGA